MTATDVLNSFSDFATSNLDLLPLAELITQIMELPEEELNSDAVEMIKGMIGGAFTPTVQKNAVKAVLEGFNDATMSRVEASEAVSNVKTLFEEMTNELKPSAYKRALIEGVFDNFFGIFEEALERYHNFDIVLPIKLENNAKTPTYAHDTDAAADLYATEDMTLPAHSLSNLIDTGVRIQLPEGWVGYVVPRSSIGLKTGLRLSNSLGVIDASYRGPIGVIYDNISDSDYTIHAGDRIAQLIVAPAYHFKPNVVDILEATERGDGGYGSTGK